MNQKPKLPPFGLAWRGAFGAVVGPVVIILLASRNSGQGLVIIYLPIVVLIAGLVGTAIGFAIGLLAFAGV
jgi:hypothetical protein